MTFSRKIRSHIQDEGGLWGLRFGNMNVPLLNLLNCCMWKDWFTDHDSPSAIRLSFDWVTKYGWHGGNFSPAGGKWILGSSVRLLSKCRKLCAIFVTLASWKAEQFRMPKKSTNFRCVGILILLQRSTYDLYLEVWETFPYRQIVHPLLAVSEDFSDSLGGFYFFFSWFHWPNVFDHRMQSCTFRTIRTLEYVTHISIFHLIYFISSSCIHTILNTWWISFLI